MAHLPFVPVVRHSLWIAHQEPADALDELADREEGIRSMLTKVRKGGTNLRVFGVKNLQTDDSDEEEVFENDPGGGQDQEQEQEQEQEAAADVTIEDAEGDNDAARALAILDEDSDNEDNVADADDDDDEMHDLRDEYSETALDEPSFDAVSDC